MMESNKVLGYVLEFTDKIEDKNKRVLWSKELMQISISTPPVSDDISIANVIINNIDSLRVCDYATMTAIGQFVNFIKEHDDFKPKGIIIHIMPLVERFRHSVNYLERLEEDMIEIEHAMIKELKYNIKEVDFENLKTDIFLCRNENCTIKSKVTHNKTTTENIHIDVVILEINHDEYDIQDVCKLIKEKRLNHTITHIMDDIFMLLGHKHVGDLYRMDAICGKLKDLYQYVRKEL